MLRNQIRHDFIGDAHQVFLLVFAFEKLLAESVDGFALLVHDVVVFEDVFPVRKVLTFNTLLRILDLLGNKSRLDGDAFFHAKALHDSGNAFRGEYAHQVVFERDVKAR